MKDFVHYWRSLTVSQLFFYGLMAIVAYLSWLVAGVFIHTIFMAGVLAIVFKPLYDWFYHHIPVVKKETLSIILTLILILLALILLINITLWALVSTVGGVQFSNIRPASLFMDINSYLQALEEEWSGVTLGNINLVNEIASNAQNIVNQLSRWTVNFFRSLVNNSAAFVINLFVMLFFVALFLTRSREVMEYLYSLSPLTDKVNSLLWRKTKAMVKSIMIGSVIVSIVQGRVGGGFLLLLQIPNAVPITVILIIVGIIPFIGSSFILSLTSIVLLFQGNYWQSLSLIAATFLVVTHVDNIIRPKLVKKEAEIPESIMLIGIIGGVQLFGPIGLLYGPLILLWLKTLLDIHLRRIE